MHKPRYLSDEQWTEAWGITWYVVRKDDVSWVQHSGGLHGFISNACFDREHKVGAIVLLNGIADAPALSMELAGIARRLVQESAPEVKAPTPTPADYKPLLGLYAPENMDELYRVEWRDGKLVICVPVEPVQIMPLEPGDEPDTFVVGLGFRDSGETVRFRRSPSGQVGSVFVGGATLLRLDPVAPEHADG